MSETRERQDKLQTWMDNVLGEAEVNGMQVGDYDDILLHAAFTGAVGKTSENFDEVYFVLANPVGNQAALIPNNTRKDRFDAQAMTCYMAYRAMTEGLDVYVITPETQTPQKLALDRSSIVKTNDMTPPPMAPEKPGFWKTFANKLTFGRAYKEEFAEYDTKLNEYNRFCEPYGSYENAVAAYEWAHAAMQRGRELIEEQVQKAPATVAEKGRKERDRIWDENTIGKTQYEKLFAPADMDRYPPEMNEEAVTSLTLACALANGAPANLHWLTSDEHSLNLTEIAVNSRQMAAELTGKYNQQDYKPMAQVIGNAINSVVQQWNAGAAQTPADAAVYAAVLDDLSNHLYYDHLLEGGLELSDDVQDQMKAIIAIDAYQKKDAGFVSELMTVNYGESMQEQRNTILIDVIAKRLFDKELKDQQQAMTKPLRDELGMSVQDNSARMSQALETYNERLKNRPLLPLEKQMVEKPASVYNEFREKARQSSIYQELSKITDPVEFRRQMIDLSTGKMNAQLSRESISVDDLGGRARQPQHTNERVSTHTMTNETQRQMNH